MRRRLSLLSRTRRFLIEDGGAAALEFAIWLTVLVPALVNAVDVGLYAYDRTQVANAAQTGAQAAWAIASGSKCTFSSTQGTSSCTGLGTAVANAISNSSVRGNSVTEDTAQEAQGYYCADTTTGALKANGTSTACPSTATAGYYYKVAVTYTYTPLFAHATVTSLLSATMNQSAWIRLQ